MKFLKEFSEYIYNYRYISINEHSKNDPIPEIIHEDKLAIFLLGTPGVGKSFFVNNYIKPRRYIHTFSSDDTSLMFTKDPNVRYKGSSKITINRIKLFMKSGRSFIYDTTPTYNDSKIELIKNAKENGYKIIFITLLSTLDTSIKRNNKRDRQASIDFIEYTYENLWNFIKKYKKFNPEAFYFITDIGNKYTFYKYNNDLSKLLKRQNDKYI